MNFKAIVTLAFVVIIEIHARKKHVKPLKELEDLIDMSGKIRKYFVVQAALLDPSTNMICSPLSALLPLAKLTLGATGKGRRQLEEAIGVKGPKELKKQVGELIQSLKHLPNDNLTIASRMFLPKELKLLTKYQEKVKCIFETAAVNLDFEAPDKAAKLINDWVSSQTQSKIKEVVTPYMITPATSVVLVNAVYFAGKWKYPFQSIKAKTFYSPNGVQEIPMMSVRNKFRYGTCDVLNVQVLEIPYTSANATFIIVLPDKKDGLPVVLNKLKVHPSYLNEAIKKLHQNLVQLTMPNFTIQTELDLKYLYQKVGIESIFEYEDSGLTEMVKHQTLTVSDAVQSAFIEVNVKGTEAAAATAVTINKLSSDMRIHFKVYHPSLYFIKVKNEVLFAGVFAEGTPIQLAQ